MKTNGHRWIAVNFLRRNVCCQCWMVRLNNPSSLRAARRPCKSAE